MLDAADGPLRMMIFGEFLLIIAVIGRSALSGTWKRSMIALILCVSAYLTISGPWGPFPPLIRALLIGGATLIPFVLWQLAWQFFDDAFRARQWQTWTGAGIFIFVTLLALASTGLWGWQIPDGVRSVIGNLLRLAGIAALIHAVWGIYRGLSTDLIEQRRTARTAAIGLSILLVVSSLVVELLISDPADRAQLEPLNALLILITTTCFAMSVLTMPSLLFQPRTVLQAPDTEPADLPDTEYRSRILAFVETGGVYQTGLSVAGMAEQVQMPEYVLRRTINGQMGFRNFNAFLNSHRIAEAKQRLRDPALARQPILTIAMDLGYGSLGPFNRAFREATGVTPSTWRQQGPENNADS